MRRFFKNIFFIFFFFAFYWNLAAITVTLPNGDKANCVLSDAERSGIESVEKDDGIHPFGFTYENVCIRYENYSYEWCTEASKNESSIPKCKDGEAKMYAKEYAYSAAHLSSENKDYGSNYLIDFSRTFDSRNYGISKLEGFEGEGSWGGYAFTGESGSAGTGGVVCRSFPDYYETVHLTRTRKCTRCYRCCGYDEKTGECNCDEYYDTYVSITKQFGLEVGLRESDCNQTVPSDYAKYAKELVDEPKCSCGNPGDIEDSATAAGEWYRSRGTTTVSYCSQVGPMKVVAYTKKFVVHAHSVALDAYCINPSLDANRSTTWDTSFDPSMCVDSLHSQVYDEATGKYKTEFNMDCGYVYIIAEAQRINYEYCGYIENGKRKIKEDCELPFSYSVITTALRLYGTGITNSELTLPGISDLMSALQQNGYYYVYKNWGGPFEYVGIPSVIPKINHPVTAYNFFVPEFYSIFIRTAKVADIYLKGKNRFTDVGNFECSGDNYNADTKKCRIDGGTYNALPSYDGKIYIVDADYYLKHKKCEISFDKQVCKRIDIQYNSSEDQERLSTENPQFPSGTTGQNFGVDGYNIKYQLTTNVGMECTYENEKGMGVLCGESRESYTGYEFGILGVSPSEGAFNDKTAYTLESSDYIDSIYLYIKALQSSKILYESWIENYADILTPIEGLTVIDDSDPNYYIIKYTLEKHYVDETSFEDLVNCDMTTLEPVKEAQCRAYISIKTSDGTVITKDHYDYCIKNYCYVKVERMALCKTSGKSEDYLYSVVATPSNYKSNIIKRIVGTKNQQTFYVYDPNLEMNDGICEGADEKLETNCTCPPEDNPNYAAEHGNIKKSNICSNNYNTYDELYYGDPSMSTILNACSDEVRKKYDFTEDLNANGNDIVHLGEVDKSRYNFQIEDDDFDVCKLYCRNEVRLYLANRTAVRAGMNLKYDIGGLLMNKKIINETVGLRDGDVKKFMPVVTLQYRECTSVFDKEKWQTLYNNASASSNQRLKNQLIYSAYNCNLYTTNEIVADINAGKIPNIFGGTVNMTGERIDYVNSLYVDTIESAMIEYSYNPKTGERRVVKDYGTTKDYLMSQEACSSIGKENGTKCAEYNLKNYSDSYLEELGVDNSYEHGLVSSNLNSTIFCNDDGCYKNKCDSGYCYNPGDSVGTYDYTTVSEERDEKGNVIHYESGNILKYYSIKDGRSDYNSVYNDWGLYYDEYGINSSNNYRYNGTIPNNKYSSFIVVSETGYFNEMQYYAEAYTGNISTSDGVNKTSLGNNILPLHLNKDVGTYKIDTGFTNVRTAYPRSSYYVEKNYSVLEERAFNKGINSSTLSSPYSFDYICYYDVDNITKPRPNGSLGFTYRVIDLNEVFSSVTDIPDISNSNTRNYPENWNKSKNKIADSVLEEIERSYPNILEEEGDNDNIDSYLEYSFTITKEGIKKIREYNKSVKSSCSLLDTDQELCGGYLNKTIYDCEYDEEEEIFIHCKSSFIENTISEQFTSAFSGDDLVINNKTENPSSLVQVNGLSEFCNNPNNRDQDFCKY